MKYGYFTYKLDTADGKVWVAESLSLKGCVGQGQTIEKAVAELEGNEDKWIETAKKLDMEIPMEPTNSYSGKISLRLEPSEHRKAAVRAKIEGISLNQYLSDAVVAKNAYQ